MNSITQNFVGGRSVRPLGTDRIEVRSPYDGEPVGSEPAATKADVDLAADAARKAFDSSTNNQMRIAREEIFGPVVCVIPYSGVDQAVAIANDAPYGLYGGVWSQDKTAAVAVAKRIRTGPVSIGGAFPNLFSPFGGFKQSGMGREFGAEALDHYVENQSIAL